MVEGYDAAEGGVTDADCGERVADIGCEGQ